MAWTGGATGETLTVTSPIDGSVRTTIEAGSATDVDRAVASARAAFEGGARSRMAPAARKRILCRLADLIETTALELAALGVRTEIAMALKAEPMSAAGTFRWYGEAIDKI